METPNFREAFKNDLTKNFRNSRPSGLDDDLKEAVNYASSMCIALDMQSNGLLTDKMTLDITNQVCDVIDMLYPVFKRSIKMRNNDLFTLPSCV